MRVEDAAPDLSWVEVTVGGSDLARQAAVYADFGRPAGFDDEQQQQGFAEGVPVFICGAGNYGYTLYRRSTRLRSIAVAYGYDDPAFSWKVNGVAVEYGSPFVLHPNQITVTVESRVPLPAGGETVTPRSAVLTFELNGSTLDLVADPAAGNFDLEIEVTAREKTAAPDQAPPTSAAQVVKMETLSITYEPAYYEALAACVHRVQDIDDRFSISTSPGPGQRFRPDVSRIRQAESPGADAGERGGHRPRRPGPPVGRSDCSLRSAGAISLAAIRWSRADTRLRTSTAGFAFEESAAPM